jgi:hypothetical protein
VLRPEQSTIYTTAERQFPAAFNACFPPLAGLIGSAVAYYLTKDKKWTRMKIGHLTGYVNHKKFHPTLCFSSTLLIDDAPIGQPDFRIAAAANFTPWAWRLVVWLRDTGGTPRRPQLCVSTDPL